MDQEQFKALMEALKSQQPTVETVSKADVEGIFEAKLTQFAESFAAKTAESINTAVTDAVQKAMPVPSRQGTGRAGEVSGEEEDVVATLVQKAQKPEELTDEDNALIWGIFSHVMSQGMKD